MMLHSSSFVRKHPVSAFVLLAYGLSWIIIFPAIMALRGELNVSVFSRIPGFLTPLVRFGPLLAAVVVSLLAGGTDELRKLVQRVIRWRFGFQWYIIAALLPVFLVYHIHFSDRTFRFGSTVVLSIPGIVVAFLQNMLLGGGQQQVGWCGFVLPRLLGRFNALKAGIIMGILQSLWHLPYLFNSWVYRGSMIYAATYITHIIAQAVVGTWLFTSTGGSVLIVALFQSSTGTFGKFLTVQPHKLVNPFSLLVLAECVLAIILVAVYGSDHLARKPYYEKFKPAAENGKTHVLYDSAGK